MVEGGLLTSGINAGDIVEPVVTVNHMKEKFRGIHAPCFLF